jgi:hypothetical protein
MIAGVTEVGWKNRTNGSGNKRVCEKSPLSELFNAAFSTKTIWLRVKTLYGHGTM